jgi:hypothetical protein
MPDFNSLEGNTVSSSTYHAPRQKLATAMPTNVVVARSGISCSKDTFDDDAWEAEEAKHRAFF